jgi:YggT family protein
MRDFLLLLINLYSLAVFAWVILSWIRVGSTHPLARVVVFLDRIIYPVILPLRRILPPLRFGGAMLDLSPIVLLFGLRLLSSIVARLNF